MFLHFISCVIYAWLLPAHPHHDQSAVRLWPCMQLPNCEISVKEYSQYVLTSFYACYILCQDRFSAFSTSVGANSDNISGQKMSVCLFVCVSVCEC